MAESVPNIPDTPDTEKRGRGRPRRTDWQQPFLDNYRAHGVQSWAAKQAGVNVATVAEERKRDQAFAAEYDSAFEESTGVLERRAVQWASGGITVKRVKTRTETRTAKDGAVTTVTVTEEVEDTDLSATMLIFLLKARKPDMYRERLSLEPPEDGGEIELKISRKEKDTAAERFGAEVVRLSEARAAKAGAQGSGEG
jgi:hypothetical protein